MRMGGYHPDNLALLATYKLIKHFNTYNVSELCGVFFFNAFLFGHREPTIFSSIP